jgi:hypothetical protein
MLPHFLFELAFSFLFIHILLRCTQGLLCFRIYAFSTDSRRKKKRKSESLNEEAERSKQQKYILKNLLLSFRSINIKKMLHNKVMNLNLDLCDNFPFSIFHFRKNVNTHIFFINFLCVWHRIALNRRREKILKSDFVILCYVFFLHKGSHVYK